MKDRCMVNYDISECDCERLRDYFTALRSTYQEYHGLVYEDYRIGIEEEIKTDPKNFFCGMMILRKNMLFIHPS
jgi:hypothetical protein